MCMPEAFNLHRRDEKRREDVRSCGGYVNYNNAMENEYGTSERSLFGAESVMKMVGGAGRDG